MYEFWYDYIEPKYQTNTNLCYMDTEKCIIHKETEDFYKDIADDLRKRYDTSNYKIDRQLPKEMNKKVIGFMKDELVGKIITEFVALRPKTYFYLIDYDKNVNKAKATQKCVIKRILKFNDYKDCLFNI